MRLGFALSATLFGIAAILHGLPWIAVTLLFLGSLALILLDVSGGLPFLMAVKPSERTEMSAVYSSFRDVSGILTPGVAWLVLLALPVWGIFGVASAGLGIAWGIAARLHPRLGQRRVAI